MPDSMLCCFHLEISIMFQQGALYFHFTTGLRNCVQLCLQEILVPLNVHLILELDKQKQKIPHIKQMSQQVNDNMCELLWCLMPSTDLPGTKEYGHSFISTNQIFQWPNNNSELRGERNGWKCSTILGKLTH